MKIEWNSYPISSISSIYPIHILPHIEHQIFSTSSRHFIHRSIINTKIWKTNWKPPSFRQVSGNTCRRGGEGGASWRMRVNRGSTRTDKPSVSVSEIWKRPLDSYVKTGWYLSSWPAESPVRTLWSPSRESYTSPAYTGPGPFRR